MTVVDDAFAVVAADDAESVDAAAVIVVAYAAAADVDAVAVVCAGVAAECAVAEAVAVVTVAVAVSAAAEAVVGVEFVGDAAVDDDLVVVKDDERMEVPPLGDPSLIPQR